MCSGRLVSIAAGEGHRLDAGLQSLRVAGVSPNAVHDVLRGIARFCLAAAPVAEHGGPKTRHPRKASAKKGVRLIFLPLGAISAQPVGQPPTTGTAQTSPVVCTSNCRIKPRMVFAGWTQSGRCVNDVR